MISIPSEDGLVSMVQINKHQGMDSKPSFPVYKTSVLSLSYSSADEQALNYLDVFPEGNFC